MNGNNKKRINYRQEIKKLLIVFLCLIGYDLVSVWAINCTGPKNYQTDLYPGGIHGLGDCIGKILEKTTLITVKNVTTFAMVFYLVVNILLLIFISRPYLDKYFTITTAAAALFLPLMGLFLNAQIHYGFLVGSERFFSLFPTESDFLWDLLRVCFSGLLMGIFQGILIKLGASTGGIDIIGKYLVVYKQKNIALIIEIFGYILILIGVCASLILKPSEFLKLATLGGIFFAILKIKLTAFIINLINHSKPQNSNKLQQTDF